MSEAGDFAVVAGVSVRFVLLLFLFFVFVCHQFYTRFPFFFPPPLMDFLIPQTNQHPDV